MGKSLLVELFIRRDRVYDNQLIKKQKGNDQINDERCKQQLFKFTVF